MRSMLAPPHPLPVRVCSSTLLSRRLTTLIVFSILLAMLPMPSTCLSSATPCHLTVANRKFPHRLVRNTPIIDRPYPAIKGGIEASCGARHRRSIGGRGILEIG